MVPFWGRCTTHFRTYFSGDWDIHWGYDLGFGTWLVSLGASTRRLPQGSAADAAPLLGAGWEAIWTVPLAFCPSGSLNGVAFWAGLKVTFLTS